jgi:pseudaminic acid biosynthesis-associated methylase
MKTEQTEFWKNDFGKEYTSRNTFSKEKWDGFYKEHFGVTKIDMNNEFLSELDKDIKILEVGCNVGNQLKGLQDMGFTNLYGIELQQGAVEKSKNLFQGLNIIQGNGFDIPFKNNFFDVVYTNGVLIHISPNDLGIIIKEMTRCSSKYIWGFEYFSEKMEEIEYRGNKGFLWKNDFARVISEVSPNFKIIKEKKYPYINAVEKGNVDTMYLLEKIS